jgi:hypothetical protein
MPEPKDDSHFHDDEARSAHGVGDGSFETQCVEWCPICRTMDVLRASTTPEVREQWQDIQRETLLTVRALIDQYVQRLADERAGAEHSADEPRRATPVEEIPIE